MTDYDQAVTPECEHRFVATYGFIDGKAAGTVATWACQECRIKFVPITALAERGYRVSKGDLDTAWKATEAALPKWWHMGSLRAAVGFNGSVASTVGWTATAHYSLAQGDAEAYGPTPAAALHALAAQLSQAGRKEP